MLELYQLVQLLAIAECGTISKAAEQLHLSQPALSRSMQKLEEELQVSLFDRQKNKITLNKNGRLAVEQARRVVEQAQNLVDQVRAFDRSQRTISIGCCAPAPLVELVSLVSQLYPEMAISSEMKDNQLLLDGLRNNLYQMIVLPYPVEDPDLLCFVSGEERLFFSLPPAHPLSGSKGLYLKDLNGEAMLLLNRLGFWKDLVSRKMPDTHFLVQEDSAFRELINASALPCFTTDWALIQRESNQNRINVPVLDPEANVTYYCLYQTANRKLLGDFLGTIQK